MNRTLGIFQRGTVLGVSIKHVDYIIEPMRHDLGFTRTQMVDDHLARLAKEPQVWSEHIDVLLDVREIVEDL